MKRAVFGSTIVRLNRLSDDAPKGGLEVSREPLATPRGLHLVAAPPA